MTKVTAKKAATFKTTRKQLLAAGLNEHKEYLLLDAEYPHGIAVLRNPPRERQRDDSGDYQPFTLNETWCLDSEQADELCQIIQNELRHFANLKAVACGIASLVDIPEVTLINEEEEEIQANLDFLAVVANPATHAEPNISAAYKRFGAIEIPSVGAAVDRVILYLNRMTPAQYADLSEEGLFGERDWVAECEVPEHEIAIPMATASPEGSDDVGYSAMVGDRTLV